MIEFTNKINELISEYNMLENTNKIFVALSGGADSMALLHFMIQYCKDNHKDIEVNAVHINHHIRGAESDRDENFVKEYCSNNNIKLFVKSFDVISIAKERKIGLEECGRELRYEYINSLCDDKTKIATAHTASDNTETLLFRLARGTGLKGACGIPPVRNNIIRPLLYITREEIEEYCQKFSLPYVIDSTNLSTDYNRNKIRHCIIPVLKEINPSIHKAVTRFTNALIYDYKFIEQITNEYKTSVRISVSENQNYYSAQKLLDIPQAIRNRIIFSICSDYNIDIDNKKCSLINNSLLKGGTVELNSKYRAVCKQGIFRIAPCNNRNNTNTFLNISPFENKYLLFGDKFYEINIVDIQEYKKFFKINNLLFKNALDYDTISSDVVFRNRLTGDKFIPYKSNVSKTLKKYFNELKIPSENRNNIIILASGSNVLWIDGIGVAKSNAVSSNTKKVMIITIRECSK